MVCGNNKDPKECREERAQTAAHRIHLYASFSRFYLLSTNPAVRLSFHCLIKKKHIEGINVLLDKTYDAKIKMNKLISDKTANPIKDKRYGGE